MSTTLVILGMHGQFAATLGYGDIGIEPPPTPPADGVEDSILGPEEGGVFASTFPKEGMGLADV